MAQNGLLIIGGLILFALSQRKAVSVPGKPAAPSGKAVTPVGSVEKPTTPVAEGAGLQLKIVRVYQDIIGLMHPGWSRQPPSMGQGVILEEGASYQVQATVKNASRRGSVHIAASFVVALESRVPGLSPFLLQEINLDLEPDETRTFNSSTFTIPTLSSDVSGSIIGALRVLGGAQVDANVLPISLQRAPENLTASIILGPPSGSTPGSIAPFMVSPAPGTALGANPLFTWNRGDFALSTLRLVASQGVPRSSEPIFDAPVAGTTEYVSLSTAPSGTTIYVSLVWQVAGSTTWQFVDYIYTKA